MAKIDAAAQKLQTELEQAKSDLAEKESAKTALEEKLKQLLEQKKNI